MDLQFYHWLNKKYPQNYIIKKPLIGTLIFLAFCLAFVVLYKPLNPRGARFFSLEFTMVIYFSSLSIPIFFLIKILKSVRYFSNPDEWTLLKEIISVVYILLGMGIALYFAGFFVEIPAHRWNLTTFLDSCSRAFLVGIIPLAFFSIINYRYLFVTDIIRNYSPDVQTSSPEQTEQLIRIDSQLKKEELSFYPSQLLYAESDSNYVVFHLKIGDQVQKKIIRNSISNIELQLSETSFIIRTHRAYIVNIKQVISQKGNTLGFRLKLNDIDAVIPVSRQKSKDFDQLIKRYR